MAAGGCCAFRHHRKWIVANVISSFFLCGSAVFLYMSIAPLAASLNCAILKISSLSSSDGAGKAAAAAIPRQILQPIIQAVPYFDFAAMLPAFISMVVVLLAAGFACCSDRTFYCSKFWVVVAMPCLLLTLGWYGALLGGGILSDRAIFLDQWNRIAGVCTTSLPMLDQALVDADAALADAERRGATGGELASAKSDMLKGQAQLQDFKELCACLGQVPTNLRALVGAGLLGLAAAIFGLVCINGLCCSTGCCKRPKKRSKVADASDGKPDDDDEVDPDSTELVEE